MGDLALQVSHGDRNALLQLADSLLDVAVEHMGQHVDVYKPFHEAIRNVSSSTEPLESFDAYLRRLAACGWGDQLTIRALAEALCISIRVHSDVEGYVPP